ncbi:MAG: GAF domain-containing protein [Desulfobacterota bacterium]|nr:GAF domain-containing protein [Thermodesulfobacteriota bacterium]
MKSEKKERTEEALRLNRDLSILNTIGQDVNESVDLDEILNRSLDKVVELTDIQSAGIYLLEENTGELVFAAHRGFSKAFAKGVKRIKLGEGATGKVALTGEPLFIEDYPSYPEALSFALEEGLRSLALIPLKSRSKIYGTLNLAMKVPYAFTPSSRNLFLSIGQTISGAMERAFLYAENVRRLEEQKTLYAIGQEIVSKLELKVILDKIIKSAIELLKADAGSIALWDNRKQAYVYVVAHGLTEILIGKEVSPSSRGIGAEVLKRKRPVLYENYDLHPNRLVELDPFHLKEVLGVPLIVREMVIGVMIVCTKDPRKHFGEKDIELLSSFGQQAAIAIGNAQLYEDSLSKIRHLTALYEISRKLSSTLDLDELLQRALELIREKWGYALCGIFLLDREKRELYIRKVIGRDFEEVKEMRFRVGLDGIVGWVAQTGEPLYVPDVSKDTRYIPGSPEGRSEAAFPLKVRDQVIGVLDLESRELNGFEEEDLKTLSSFASQVSIFIENAQLFSDLRQTLSELRQAQDQIIQAEKLRAMGEMASGVAHDFNNVLAAILGNIQLLLHSLETYDPEEIRERLRTIEKAAKDGAETVRRIQEFTGKRRDREFIPLSLNDLIQEVAAITEPRWKDQPQKKGIFIELEKELGDIPPVLGNPSELREVLTNIVFNAVDAMPKGGRITIATHPHSEDWVEVRISDTGIGMSEEVKKRIFDPFFTTKGVTSSGLGLSVSYGIIKRHGGEILVESEPGKGTTFLLHLPVGYGEEVKEVDQGAKRPAGALRSARILVIDDEEAVRDVLSRMLQAKGHRVEVASGGEEGIERFKKQPFDLVFTDLGMPKISGWEVGKRLKELNPKIPVIMITGWGMELDRKKMTESGIDLIISKPFSFDQVTQLIHEALDLKERM